MNINRFIRKKQLMMALGIFLGVMLTGGGTALFLKMSKKDNEIAIKEPVPDMSGVVGINFGDEVQEKAIFETQRTGKEMDVKYQALSKEIRLLSESNLKLHQQLNEMKKKNDETFEAFRKKASPEVFSGVETASEDGKMRPPDRDFRYDGMGSAHQKNTTFTVMPSGLERKVFSVNEEKNEKKSRFPYVPSGSFAKAIVIEGADANASVTGSQNTSPMQLRLTGKVQMPNDKEYDLSGCFVTLEAYGNVSSERAEVRTRALSCHLQDDVIDQKIAGHVSFRGKNGIKGEVVMKNGKILGFAWGAGFLSGIGEGVKSAGTTTVGIGATASPNMSDIFKGGLGGGTSEAAKTLSEYYIKRAEQYHPVIPIGAGNEVTLVFQDGFQLKTLAEKQKSKTKKSEHTFAGDDKATKTTLNDFKKFELGNILPKDALTFSPKMPGSD